MLEIYAVIASIFLPTGLISLIHFLCNINKKNKPISWIMIIESIVTICLGIFYAFCAIILSQASVSSDAHFVNNNIDDLAIINDTTLNQIETLPNFYDKNQPIPLDQTNEVEDTRNNKNKANPSEVFLLNYRYLVQKAVKKMLQNGTTDEYRLKHVRKMKQPLTDTSENQDCLLRIFFHQALLVHSFVTCAISLLNICHLCNECEKNEKPPTVQKTKTENPSETFGEKILDVSDNSSQNAAPIGPLFDEDSLASGSNGRGGLTTNLDVFNVKKISEENMDSGQALKEKTESKTCVAVKCLIMLTFPSVFVTLLYLAMESSHNGISQFNSVTFDHLLHNFNLTFSNMPKVNLVKTFSIDEDSDNGTHQKEIENILHRVYAVIHKFEKEHKQPNDMSTTVKGQYLSNLKSPNKNSTENCLGDDDDKITLKTFDFLVFVVLFFVVILYTKMSEIKLPQSISTRTLSKCTSVFLVLWTPSIIDVVVSMFITNREPNIFSSLLLLGANMDRVHSTVQNVVIYKRYAGKGSGFIKPVFK